MHNGYNRLHMAKTIKISDSAFEQAKSHAKISKRSVPKQIEYWSSIGKIAEENPDLSYRFIREIMISMQEYEMSAVTEYQFGT